VNEKQLCEDVRFIRDVLEGFFLGVAAAIVILVTVYVNNWYIR
jgi:hypothetical protein